MKAMASASTRMPNGVKLKKLKGSMPRLRRALLMTMFGVVATSVIMPLMSAAAARGMSSRRWLRPAFSATARVMGMKMAAVAVLLMNEPTRAEPAMSRTSRRTSLVPPRSMMASPMRWASPVWTMASLITNMEAMITTTGLDRPERASPGSSTPVSMRVSMTSTATRSPRIQLVTSSTAAPARVRTAMSISGLFINDCLERICQVSGDVLVSGASVAAVVGISAMEWP